jgi:hypothetical protein
MMTGNSTLDPDNFPDPPDRQLGVGHGNRALGPSDSSDSGSDTTSDAGPDSDTDAGGTGECGAAGSGGAVRDGADIDVDHVETIPGALDEEDLAFLHSSPPR